MVNVYVDMDGVQAIYGAGDTVEKMSEVGYFRNRPVQENVVDFIKLLSADKCFNVSILSAVFDDNHSGKEKMLWLKENGLEKINVIFTPCGSCKGEYVNSEGLNILIDDYTKNLFEWEKQGKNYLGIKFDNGINGRIGNWKRHGGIVINKDMSPCEMLWIMRVVYECTSVA